MEIVVIDGGLGNQMSQYAMALIRKKSGSKVLLADRCRLHNGYELERLFGVKRPARIISFLGLAILYMISDKAKSNCISRVMSRLLSSIGITVLAENYCYDFNEDNIKVRNNLLNVVYGGWHHWKYIEYVKEEVSRCFSYPAIKEEKNNELLGKIEWGSAVAIHIRRGDYMDPKNYSQYGAVCSEQYYKKAISKMAQDIENPIFYIFTNDVDWAIGLLKDYNYVCVDWNKGLDSWKDQALMSKFKNIIIANSTFSWWAAWLGEGGKKVVCPPYLINKDYSSDIFPKEWYHVTPNELI